MCIRSVQPADANPGNIGRVAPACPRARTLVRLRATATFVAPFNGHFDYYILTHRFGLRAALLCGMADLCTPGTTSCRGLGFFLLDRGEAVAEGVLGYVAGDAVLQQVVGAACFAGGGAA